MLVRIIAVVALVAVSGATLAQDVEVTGALAPVAPTTVAPISSDYDWTGPSVGLSFGYLDADTSGAASVDGDGGIIGLRAGYDHDFGDYVLGGTIQYDAGDVDLDGVTYVESVFRFGGRAGLDSGRNLYYLTGGWARANTSESTIGNSDGYFAGLGYEVFVTDRVTAGAEVLYHDFDDFDLDGLDAEATTLNLSLGLRF